MLPRPISATLERVVDSCSSLTSSKYFGVNIKVQTRSECIASNMALLRRFHAPRRRAVYSISWSRVYRRPISYTSRLCARRLAWQSSPLPRPTPFRNPLHSSQRRHYALNPARTQNPRLANARPPRDWRVSKSPPPSRIHLVLSSSSPADEPQSSTHPLLPQPPTNPASPSF